MLLGFRLLPLSTDMIDRITSCRVARYQVQVVILLGSMQHVSIFVLGLLNVSVGYRGVRVITSTSFHTPPESAAVSHRELFQIIEHCPATCRVLEGNSYTVKTLYSGHVSLILPTHFLIS